MDEVGYCYPHFIEREIRAKGRKKEGSGVLSLIEDQKIDRNSLFLSSSSFSLQIIIILRLFPNL